MMDARFGNGLAAIPAEELRRLAASLLEKVGVSAEDAATAADVMVYADLKGVESHGVRWLDIYLQRIKAGGVNPKPKVEVLREKAGLLLLDGKSGLGQVAMSKAIERGIAKAQDAGMCAVAVRNSNHFGAAGYYAELAAKANMACMVMTNSTPLMAPWGGVTPCLGTNPVAFGFPSDETPVVVDMATSAIARSKVFLAAQKGDSLPPGVALNLEGAPTTDPKEAIEGVLLPLGGPKGYGLALVIDILSGVLSGSRFGRNIPSLFGAVEQSQDIGHFAMLINIEDFLSLDEFLLGMRRNKDALKSARLADGFEQIYLPGEQSAAIVREREKAGIVLSAATWSALNKWRTHLGVQ
jgi:LDH2 family malate/lactate/ureidoglycolate dehydrogenase